MQCNWLTPSAGKSSFIIYVNVSSDQLDVSLSIRGVNLTKVSRANFLGVIRVENLMFDDFADLVVRKLSGVISIIYKAKPCLSKATMKLLYISLNWSPLNYGVLAWS